MFRQGDRERALGQPVSPLMDRTKGGVTKSQTGFFNIVALPIYTVGMIWNKVGGEGGRQWREAYREVFAFATAQTLGVRADGWGTPYQPAQLNGHFSCPSRRPSFPALPTLQACTLPTFSMSMPWTCLMPVQAFVQAFIPGIAHPPGMHPICSTGREYLSCPCRRLSRPSRPHRRCW